LKSLIASTSVWLLLTLADSAGATVIDFEAQAAGRGGSLTGIPDSPLTVGIATFTGGELLHAEINIPADQTGVYATEGLFGSDTNPLVIHFAVPVNGFSVFIANGDSTQTYTLSDDLGDTTSVMLALSASISNSARTVSLAGDGITTVSITSANADFWNFAIDNVTFAAVPEPQSTLVVLGGLALMSCCGRKLRSGVLK
jgi:hypothetical protein